MQFGKGILLELYLINWKVWCFDGIYWNGTFLKEHCLNIMLKCNISEYFSDKWHWINITFNLFCKVKKKNHVCHLDFSVLQYYIICSFIYMQIVTINELLIDNYWLQIILVVCNTKFKYLQPNQENILYF